MKESPAAPEQPIRERVFHGAAWMLTLRVCDRLIGLVSVAVLARLLVPADFGVVALAQSLIALIALFGAFGLETALIQNRNAERKHYDTVWTFNVLFAAFMAAALALSARPTADFYGDARLVAVVLILAAAQFVRGFSNVGVVGFQKELEFDREFRLRMATRITTTFAVTLPAAFLLQDFRALVAGSFTAALLEVVLSVPHASIPPALLTRRVARALFVFEVDARDQYSRVRVQPIHAFHPRASCGDHGARRVLLTRARNRAACEQRVFRANPARGVSRLCEGLA